ncbi:MAG: transcriptional repressor [Chloroflexi bacterium]|nr:transcriptional repressor [Chloroflexota bacterium]
MNQTDELITTLRETGYRLTPQRMMILDVIRHSTGHITAEQIHSAVMDTYPYLDISTVYRTLELLRDLRLISETNLGGGVTQYEYKVGKRPHHHLICSNCGETVSLGSQELEPVEHLLLEKYGFKVDFDHLAIFGQCAHCRREQANEPVEGNKKEY